MPASIIRHHINILEIYPHGQQTNVTRNISYKVFICSTVTFKFVTIHVKQHDRQHTNNAILLMLLLAAATVTLLKVATSR